MIRNIGIGRKLMGGYLLMAALVCATGAIGIFYADAVGREGLEVGAELAPLGDAAMEIKISATLAHLKIEEITGGDEGESIDEAYALIRRAITYCDFILSGGRLEGSTYVASRNPEVRQRIAAVKEALRGFLRAARERYHTRNMGDGAAAGTEAERNFDRQFESFIGLADQAESLINRDIRVGMRELRESQQQARSIMVGAMVAGLFMALIAGLLLGRSITAPIVDVANLSKQVAGGDLTVSLGEVNRGDEVGVLYSSFSTMVEGMRSILRGVKDGVGTLTASTTEIATTAQQSATTATEQASTVSQVSTTVAEIRQTSQAAAETAKEVVDSAEHAVGQGEEGLKAIDEAVELMEVISERVTGVGSRILELSEQNAQIGEIIETVNDIAEQSNLLAVNASIEAAKAGEHGRGFGVVAAEVRTLAEQSKRAAHQVRGILGEIRRATESAVMATEESAKRVEEGQRTVNFVQGVITDLRTVLTDSSSRARQIEGAARQQAAGISEIAGVVDTLSAAGRENASAARQLEQSASALATLTHDLRDATNRYQV